MSFIASFKPRNLRIDSTKTGFPLAFSGSWVITGGWKLPTFVGNLQVELKQVDHGHAFRLRRRDGSKWIWNGCELEDFYISYQGSTIGWVVQILRKNCWIDWCWCWCFCFFLCKGLIGSKKQVFKIVESFVFHNFWNTFIPSLFPETGSCLNEKLVVVSPWPIA